MTLTHAFSLEKWVVRPGSVDQISLLENITAFQTAIFFTPFFPLTKYGSVEELL